MSERDEDTQSLKALRERTRAALRAGLDNVSRLEPACDPKELRSWLEREAERYGGKPVEVPDE